MRGIIKIADLKVRCTIGVSSEEREKEQELSIDLDLESNFSKCVTTDAIEDAINYDEVIQLVRQTALSKPFRLLETFASELLHALFESFPVSWAKITVKKPALCAAIELERRR
ncbi:MAG: Dihydroneopterin triphosphate 2'-epimerase [Chlamydiae bacterium]|nr:Dihydroneopterin triphosphate 2'-epimerase [Chlamydiota bacterium]